MTAPLPTLRERKRRDLAQVERAIPTLDRAMGDAMRDPHKRNMRQITKRWLGALELRKALKSERRRGAAA